MGFSAASLRSCVIATLLVSLIAAESHAQTPPRGGAGNPPSRPGRKPKEPLEDRLVSPDNAIRRQAVLELGKERSAANEERLRKIASTDTDFPVRQAAMSMVLVIDDAKQHERLIAALRDGKGGWREAATSSTAVYNDKSLLFEAASGKVDAETKKILLRMVPVIVAAKTFNEVPNYKLLALESLSLNVSPITIFSDKDRQVMEAAAPGVVELMSDRSPEVKAMAIQTFSRFGSAAWPMAVGLVGSKDPAIAAAATEVLALMPADRALTVLTGAATTGPPASKAAALKALFLQAQSAPASAKPEIQRVLRVSLMDESPVVRIAALSAAQFEFQSSPELAVAVEAALYDSDPGVRAAVTKTYLQRETFTPLGPTEKPLGDAWLTVVKWAAAHEGKFPESLEAAGVKSSPGQFRYVQPKGSLREMLCGAPVPLIEESAEAAPKGRDRLAAFSNGDVLALENPRKDKVRRIVAAMKAKNVRGPLLAATDLGMILPRIDKRLMSLTLVPWTAGLDQYYVEPVRGTSPVVLEPMGGEWVGFFGGEVKSLAEEAKPAVLRTHRANLLDLARAVRAFRAAKNALPGTVADLKAFFPDEASFARATTSARTGESDGYLLEIVQSGPLNRADAVEWVIRESDHGKAKPDGVSLFSTGQMTGLK